MPDKELILKWISMLREEDRKQTTGRLIRTGQETYPTTENVQPGQCCLGVLCEAAGMEVVKSAVGSFGYKKKTPAGRAKVYLVNLPKNLMSRAGLTKHDESLLVGMNDNSQDNFAQIADYLEETYRRRGQL